MIIIASVLIIICLVILIWEILSPFSWENTDFWLKIASGVLAGFTFIVGTIAIISGYYLSERQNQQIRNQEENIETLKKNNLNLETTLEQERSNRLKLEESVKPRELAVSGIARTRLRVYAETPFKIETVQDGEARYLAERIRDLLTSVGWSEIKSIETKSAPDGIRIETINMNKAKENKSLTAATVLAEFLEANEWEAKVGPNALSSNSHLDEVKNDKSIVDGTVIIRVGRKPTQYFRENSISDTQTRQRLDEVRKEKKVRREKLKEEWELYPPQ